MHLCRVCNFIILLQVLQQTSTNIIHLLNQVQIFINLTSEILATSYQVEVRIRFRMSHPKTDDSSENG